MSKIIKYILLIVILFNISNVKAKEVEGRVNLYLFYLNTCQHCAKEKEALKDIQSMFPNLRIYMFELSANYGRDKISIIEEHYNISIRSVPYTIIGDKRYSGYNGSSSKETLINTIEYYTEYGYIDEVGQLLGIDELPKVIKENIDIDDYIEDKYNVDIPLIGSVSMKNLALPLVTVIIGLVDGFNPCAMWVLLFLISLLIGMENKKRMWILGLTFIVTSAFIYFLFMLSWLNVTSYLSSANYIRLGIGIVAIVGGLINLIGYIKTQKEDGCTVVEDKKRKKIINKIKTFTREKNFFLALFGIITVAISVNLIELLCSAGLPITYIEILKLGTDNQIEYILYILFYVFFFMLDDIIIFTIAMTTLKMTGLSNKYGKLSKLIGGIILVLVGLLLIFKPEWLMFNF